MNKSRPTSAARLYTPRATLCALGVKGVPRIALEEALWCAAETLYT